VTSEDPTPSFEGIEPEIEYPCTWSYRLIGSDEGQLRAHVTSVVGERAHFVELSNRSSQGSYISLRLEIGVEDDADRRGLFAALETGEGVLYVL
jgi:putative lipoic acid-binding regulatory protein